MHELCFCEPPYITLLSCHFHLSLCVCGTICQQSAMHLISVALELIVLERREHCAVALEEALYGQHA